MTESTRECDHAQSGSKISRRLDPLDFRPRVCYYLDMGADRHFIFEDTGELKNISGSKIGRIRDLEETIPEYANRAVKFATVLFDTKNRRLVSAWRIDYWIWHFDADGRLDEEKHSDALRLVLNARGANYRRRDENVIDASREFYQKTYKSKYTWQPSPEEKAALSARIEKLLKHD